MNLGRPSDRFDGRHWLLRYLPYASALDGEGRPSLAGVKAEEPLTLARGSSHTPPEPAFVDFAPRAYASAP